MIKTSETTFEQTNVDRIVEELAKHASSLLYPKRILWGAV